MTREELFRAVGEVREDQIEGAETVKKQIRPWRRYGALAACLALIVTAAAAVPWIEKQIQWKALVYSFDPGAEPVDAGTGAGGVDGSDYSTDAPAQSARSSYSKNVEIGELSGPGDGDLMSGMASCSVWLAPEEIFAQDTAIFRGTVRELQYFAVNTGSTDLWYTRAIVEITDPIRGDLAEGETVSLLWLGAKGYMTTSLSGPLDDITEGSDAIFMPTRTTPETGREEGETYFCYADLADYYLSEGNRYVFADTGEGLEFDRSLYMDLAEAETLEDLAAGIRKQIGAEQEPPARSRVGRNELSPDPEVVWLEGEHSEIFQPAAEPVTPQINPSKTENAAPPSTSGPNGAREMPGGAPVGDEQTGETP